MSTSAVGGGSVNVEGFLKFLLQMHRSGYALGLNVTQRGAGANMSVDVNVTSSNMAGGLFATSANIPYFGYMDAAVNTAISTSDPSNPRRDIIVAYIDLSLITTSTTNNAGALKFIAVAGTPAGSPSDPSDPTIQSAVGAGNPYLKLARVAVAAAASTIVNANITDLRVPAALQVPYLYGGSSNTVGHLVPNAADDTVALLNAYQTFTNKNLGSQSALVAAQESTTSTTVTDLATVGPQVTVTVGTSGKVRVTMTCSMFNNTASQFVDMYLTASGANTIAPNAVQSLQYKVASGNSDTRWSYSGIITGLTPGSTTFLARYAVSGGTGSFSARELHVETIV